MQKRIRVYFLAFSILTIVSSSMYAAPKQDKSGESFFTRVKNAIVRILDDAKIVVPVG